MSAVKQDKRTVKEIDASMARSYRNLTICLWVTAACGLVQILCIIVRASQ